MFQAVTNRIQYNQLITVQEIYYDPPDRSVPAVGHLVPDDPNSPYDIKVVVNLNVDHGDTMEIVTNIAEIIVNAFARADRHTVGGWCGS